MKIITGGEKYRIIICQVKEYNIWSYAVFIWS